MELRVVLGRLLERLEQIEQASHDAVLILRGCVSELEGEERPPVRDMIAEAMNAAQNTGLTRTDIVDAIRRDYGIEISPNTITGTLGRMQRAGAVRHRGQFWFIRSRRGT